MSLSPRPGGNGLHGADGAQATEADGAWVLRRETPGVQVALRGMLRLKESLDAGALTEADALVFEVRLPRGRNATLQLRWRAGASHMVEGGRVALTGDDAFREVALPMPLRPGKRFEQLHFFFHPDPGEAAFRGFAIARPRDVTLTVDNPPGQVQASLRVRGTVTPPDAKIEVCVENSRGEIAVRETVARDGAYALEWKRPPVNIGKDNRVFARRAGDKDPRGTSLAAPAFGFRADDRHLWLRVKGKEIVTAPESAGGVRPFVPVGIGYAKDVILPGQDEEVMAFCRERGLNTVRLPFYTRFFNNRDAEPIDLDSHLRDFVDPVVLAAKKHGLYVILDDHGYFSEKINEEDARKPQRASRWNEAGVADWIERWTRVAERYRDEPAVLGYELMNEPHDIAPGLAREWYTRCLKAIRQVDDRHIVLVGSNDWSHARSLEATWGPTASTVDAPHNNVVFAFHDYPEDNHPWIVRDRIVGFRDRHNVPVLCTEFGATHWNKSETVCRTFLSGMVALFAKEGAGWMIWALKRLEDHPRAPYNEVDKVGVDPKVYDSCAYSDLWIPAARILATPVPKPGQ